MSGDRQSSGRDPEFDLEVEAALRAVDRPAARSEFCDELRDRFLAPAESLPASGRVPAEGHPRGRWIGVLLAAGLILALGYYVLRPQPSSWRVLEIAPGSVVKADGVSVPVQDLEALARSLQGAKEIEIVSGDLILQVGDVSLFDMDQGTRVIFQELDAGDAVPIQVLASSGRLRARTGPDFDGRKMRVRADLMDVFVTGTAFALDYEAHGTCICCLHGDLRISSKILGPDSKPVPPEHMCLIYRAKEDSKAGGLPEKHAQPLRSLEERARAIWP